MQYVLNCVHVSCRFSVVFRTQNFHNFVKVALTKQPKRRPTSDKLLEVSS